MSEKIRLMSEIKRKKNEGNRKKRGHRNVVVVVRFGVVCMMYRYDQNWGVLLLRTAAHATATARGGYRVPVGYRGVDRHHCYGATSHYSKILHLRTLVSTVQKDQN